MLDGLQTNDGGDDPYIVHLNPTVHFEIDAESRLEAQSKAMQQLVDGIETTNLDIEQVELGGIVPNHPAMLKQQLGLDESLDNMFEPPSDTDMQIGDDFDGDGSGDDESSSE